MEGHLNSFSPGDRQITSFLLSARLGVLDASEMLVHGLRIHYS